MTFSRTAVPETTKKPLSQKADFLIRLRMVTEFTGNTTNHLSFTVTDSGENFDQTHQFLVKLFTLQPHLMLVGRSCPASKRHREDTSGFRGNMWRPVQVTQCSTWEGGDFVLELGKTIPNTPRSSGLKPTTSDKHYSHLRLVD